MTDALKKVPGVQSIEIDLGSHRATVGFDGSKTAGPQLAAAIRDAGFSPE